MEGQETARIPYTLAQAYRDICTGTPPWVALNEFLHEWVDYAGDRRAPLVAEPIPIASPSEAAESESWRWAVFCAATADWLCGLDRVERPAWVDEPVYMLVEPWYGFDAPGADKPHVRGRLERTTPEPFLRRNILCGDRVSANKYAFARAHAVRRRPADEASAPTFPTR